MSNAPTQQDRKPSADERDSIYQKIGRNVILYQQLELLLKHIVGTSSLSAPISKVKQIQESNRKKTNTSTMGNLVGRFVENIDPNSADDDLNGEEVTEAMLSYRFHLEISEGSYEEKKQTLSRIVAGRNRLIHHTISEYDFKSIDSMKKLSKDLDQQEQEVRKEIDELKTISKNMIKAQTEYVNYLSSEEFKAHFELVWLRGSLIVTTLIDIANQLGDERGAVSLNVAGHLLATHIPEEKAAMKERYGYSSLKQLILAMGLFEIIEEPTNKGGLRISYKLIDD
jgi:hypothetical protein